MFSKVGLNLRDRFLVVPFLNLILVLILLFFIYGLISDYNKNVKTLQKQYFTEIKANGKTMALIIETHNHLYSLIKNAKELNEAQIYEGGSYIFNNIRDLQLRVEKHSVSALNKELEQYLIVAQEIVEMSSVDLNLATSYYDEANTIFIDLSDIFKTFQQKQWDTSDSFLNYLSNEITSGIEKFILLTVLLTIAMIFLAFSLARVLSKEFELLIGMMKKLSYGEFEKVKNIPYTQREDEIGQIANTVYSFRNSLNLISHYVILSRTDLSGKIIEASDSFCKISGYTKDELVGQPHNIVRHPDMPKSLFKNIWETIQAGKPWSGEIKNRRKDGGYYWVEVNISPEYDKNGDMISYLAIRHDITSKKDFEEQHQQLLKSEKLASMGEMIGNIAHQWRQPLSVISVGASGLKIEQEFGTLTDEKILSICDSIDDNAQYLSKTIDDFQNFIKGDRTKIVFDLKHSINSFLNLVQGVIKNNHINVVLDIEEGISIDGYENELIQCIMNIFNNAKDAMVLNDVKEKYIFLHTMQKNGKAVITIRDNGGGIPKDVIHKIFEPYFTTKHKSKGTGLGLHMTHNLIVHGMNGTLEVRNKEYEYENKIYTGAEFSISLSI